jgi:uncharacterized ferritin-like protein (DUF455 family)
VAGNQRPLAPARLAHLAVRRPGHTPDPLPQPAPATLRQACLPALLCTDADRKAALAQSIATCIERRLPSGSELALPQPPGIPGRPERPVLVAPGRVRRRDLRDRAGRATLIHALAHIELNAIDLALDAAWRFPGLPEAYYREWLQVAIEEAHHFSLLHAHLRDMGHAYGDFPAHGSLWEMAEKTREDVLARMALVPRTLEARGLDASPPVRARLWAAGDTRAAQILDVILRDEIGHVAVGNRWFHHLCRERGLDPLDTYADLARRHRAPVPRGPFNLDARRAAGFSEPELEALQAGPRSAPGSGPVMP